MENNKTLEGENYLKEETLIIHTWWIKFMIAVTLVSTSSYTSLICKINILNMITKKDISDSQEMKILYCDTANK